MALSNSRALSVPVMQQAEIMYLTFCQQIAAAMDYLVSTVHYMYYTDQCVHLARSILPFVQNYFYPFYAYMYLKYVPANCN